MKLHTSVVEKLLNIYTNFGGFSNETKLKEQLENLDLTPYERKTTDSQEVILVVTEDYVRELSQRK
jgi:hypothetical protein